MRIEVAESVLVGQRELCEPLFSQNPRRDERALHIGAQLRPRHVVFFECRVELLIACDSVLCLQVLEDPSVLLLANLVAEVLPRCTSSCSSIKSTSTLPRGAPESASRARSRSARVMGSLLTVTIVAGWPCQRCVLRSKADREGHDRSCDRCHRTRGSLLHVIPMTSACVDWLEGVMSLRTQLSNTLATRYDAAGAVRAANGPRKGSNPPSSAQHSQRP